ncbi:uncharacterized protein K441DRAFT_679976 [Cenococcum geophilum 1.58]|uniref:uncharacterized protein n=1 Tax=Cenococcum geophilum 1.58 TaxID=794803 RepID=UPI00358E8EA1|nr:hypothetical protein K441DRAFT_679976 [Cenococcum geophilum 1.58]
MAPSLPDLPVELINLTLSFIPKEEIAIIPVRKACRALASKTMEIFAREYFSLGSWCLRPGAVSALTGISKNKFLNPTLEDITLFRYTNEYEYGSEDSGLSLARRVDIKELGQSLQTLANLRSLCLADFGFRGFEKFLGDLLATLSLPSITDFKLLEIILHSCDLQNFITLHSNTIKTVVFDKLDLTAPAEGAWSGLLSSLTLLKDVKLIRIREPLKCGDVVRFEPEVKNYYTFWRYVDWNTEYECDCDSSPSYAEYRLGTDTKKEDWTRGLELMMAGSRTVQFFGGSSSWIRDPDP